MKSRIRRRLGRKFRPWRDIPPPELPPGILRLEPRLRNLPENAVLRFVMFLTGLGGNPFLGRLGEFVSLYRNPIVGLGVWPAGLILGPLLMTYPRFAVSVMAALLFLGLCAVAVSAVRSILRQAGALPNPMGLLDPAVVLREYLCELRAVPLSAEDFALAQWGGMLLGSPHWRMHPAWALQHCCSLVRASCEKLSGWTYYPSTFGVDLDDALHRGEVGALSRHGRVAEQSESTMPFLGDQLKVSPATFNYSARFGYLIGLWREYLDIYHPEAPEEGEVRRAMRPGVYRASVDAIIEKSSRAAKG